MTIADRIRERRIELELSQTDLAKRAGYSDRTTISKFEHMGNEITMKQIKRVAEALNVTPAYLMGWEDFVDDVQKGNVDIDDLQHAIDMYRKYKGMKSEVRHMVDYLLETGFEIETTRQD